MKASRCAAPTLEKLSAWSRSDIRPRRPAPRTAEATVSHSSPISPPPFMVGMVEIELDKETGLVTVLDYMAVVDCGLPINPALARIQTEGGIVQGIGHTLMEEVRYDHNGRPIGSSFMQYKLPYPPGYGTAPCGV